MNRESHLSKKQIIPLRFDSDFFYRRGLACYRKGELRRASRYIDRALRMKPNNVEYLCRQAEILSELEEYESSISLLRKVVRDLDSRMTDCYFFMANNYAYLGEFEQALTEVKTYIALEPHGAFAREARELYDMLSGEETDQEEQAEKEPDYVWLHERGRAALEHGRLQESVNLFQEVGRKKSSFLPARNNLAIAYFSLGEAEKAVQTAESVLASDPGNIHALCNLAAFFHQLGMMRKAKAVVRRLDGLLPVVPEYCGKIGSTYLFIGEYEKAYHWLKIAEKRGAPSDQVFSFWLALAAFRTGRLAVAERCWKETDYFSSKPFHPFKYGKIQDMMFEPDAKDNFMVRDLIRKEIRDSGRAYQLFSLFYLSRSGDRQLMLEVARSGQDARLRQLAQRFLNESPACGSSRLNVMRLIEQMNGGEKETMRHPELYSFWAVIDEIAGPGESIDCKGWAAALYYLWEKEAGRPTSQKTAAARAETTVYRLRKHIRELTEVLDKKWTEKTVD
jgi:tetratricopeptide (TPR) repeat protein